MKNLILPLKLPNTLQSQEIEKTTRLHFQDFHNSKETLEQQPSRRKMINFIIEDLWSVNDYFLQLSQIQVNRMNSIFQLKRLQTI
jgi:hypothetical protein